MKYLNKYNEYVYDLPKEKWWKGTEECSIEQAFEIIKGLKEWNINDYKIERSVWGLPHIMIIDPKQHTRASANTKNYYTLIIDNSPKWKNFPKRGNSLICNLTNRKNIDESNYYTIIPFDGSKWGHANQYDFWEAFRPTIEASLNSINNMIDSIMKELEYSFPNNLNFHMTINNLKQVFSELDKKICDSYLIKTDEESMKKKINSFFYYNKDLFDSIINAAQTNGIYNWYHEILDPVKNGIECFTYPELLKNQSEKHNHPKMPMDGYESEVWTDSKCLLIKNDILLDIRGKISKLNLNI